MVVRAVFFVDRPIVPLRKVMRVFVDRDLLRCAADAGFQPHLHTSCGLGDCGFVPVMRLFAELFVADVADEPVRFAILFRLPIVFRVAARGHVIMRIANVADVIVVGAVGLPRFRCHAVRGLFFPFASSVEAGIVMARLIVR